MVFLNVKINKLFTKDFKMEKRIKWHVEKRKVKDLKPYERNPRIISDLGLSHLKRSFDEIGFAQPININLDNTILSGHARVQQLLKEGVEEVDCYIPDRQLTPKQEEAVIIRMNKNVAGEWDFKMLRDEFNWSDLEDYGFIENELELEIDKNDKEDSEVKINFEFKLEVDCISEENQQILQGELNDRGFKVRVLI